jgi:hypothetical protein
MLNSLFARRLSFFATILGLALVGCKSQGPVTHLHAAQPPALTGDDFMNSGEGFTINLPSSWKRLPAGSTPNPEAMANVSTPSLGFGAPPPSLADKASELALVDTSVKVVPTDAPVMVRFNSTKVSGGANVTSQAADYVAQAYDGDHKDVKPYVLPIGEVVEVTARKHMITGDNFYFVDYIVVDGENVVKVRFVGNDANNIKMTAEKAMETFRLDPNAHTKVQDVKEFDPKELMDQLKSMGAGGAPPVNPDGTPQ